VGRAASRQYVFGYGSLLERAGGQSAAVRELEGYRRTWNVAMDNTRTIPGYKHYLDEATGERRPWFVTFLNIVPDEGACVNGVLLAVEASLLERLDGRERNYKRADVSERLREPADGQVWAYIGVDDAVRRFELGRRTGRGAISRDYYERVREDFASVGALERFDELTDPPPCPILDLRRIDHPEPATARRC
jgi:cation transport regulator ChaC